MAKSSRAAQPRPTLWPLVYIAIGLFGAFGAQEIQDPNRRAALDLGDELLAIGVFMPALSAFAGFMSYFALRRRCTPAHLRADIWHSAPLNPQSNQLAQIIFFGSFGFSAVLRWSDARLRDFGLFALWMALALLVSQSIFRLRRVPRPARPSADVTL